MGLFRRKKQTAGKPSAPQKPVSLPQTGAPEPEQLSEQQARESLSPLLKVNTCRMALIPTPGGAGTFGISEGEALNVCSKGRTGCEKKLDLDRSRR